MCAVQTICLLCVLASTASTDVDTDGDGLSDYQERHKYFTDPLNEDSDGDGKLDSEWVERREYTYTVRSILHILPPYNSSAMNDDYQDARLLYECPEYGEFEVVHYPLNTNDSTIVANKNWRADSRSLTRYIEPGVTSNWDQAMREQLLRRLLQDGIDVSALSDQALVEQVSAWLCKHAQFEDSFTTFSVLFDQGRPHVHPDLIDSTNATLKKNKRSIQEQWRHELFGKGMFETRTRGSCTSSAIYLQTALRALGMPTRTIICTPVVDASDPQELRLIENLKHNGVRRTLQRSTRQLGSSWASHTFNEVYVAGRWRRLNYNKLAQNTLDAETLGLMTHVHTFQDHAQAGLVNWGLRNHHKPRNDVFGGSNPYSAIALSDEFGVHCTIENPPSTLTITRAYFVNSSDHPEWLTVTRIEDDPSGHFLAHVSDRLDSKADYYDVYKKLDPQFELIAYGYPTIKCAAERGFWLNSKQSGAEFYFRIPPEELAKMKKGVRYQLFPRNKQGECRWVTPGVVWLVQE